MNKLFGHIIKIVRTRKASITWKLFVVTALMFIIFISVEFILQSVFIKKFYDDQKERKSIEALNNFCAGYVQNDWSSDILDNKITAMSDTYDIQLTILNTYGYNKLGGLEMAVKTAEGKEIIIDLHDITFIDGLKSGGMEKGATIEVKGVFSADGSKLEPFEISVDRTQWKRGNTADGNSALTLAAGWNLSPGSIVQLQGTIEFLRLMNEDEYKNSASPFVALSGALAKWQDENIKIPSYKQIQDYKDISTGSRYKMFVLPIDYQNGSREAVFAIVPLQPVDEAVGVIKNYLVYIFIGALVFVFVLSYIFSRMVAQPLIKINEAAVRMSHMDFDTKCEIRTKDELGSLSDSLNTMASKLDSAIEELKEFVSNASHELKTPIATISGYVEALKDNIRNDKKERYLERLQDEVERMNLLVRDMLELSRMESNTRVLNCEPFDLRDLTEEILDEFSGSVLEKGIGITFISGHAPSVVFADRIKVGQVIRNFVSNAIRHTESGGEIWIDIRKEQNGMEFLVENQGSSIPEEKLDRIWDRFYRVETSRARDNGGTGLGLAISAKILQLHNAQYGARNTERGVLFFFLL